MAFVGIIICGAVAIFFLLWIVIALKKHEDFFKNIPGHPPLPFFGHILEVSSTTEILDRLMIYQKTYGGIFKLHIGPFKKRLIVSDYKFLECILGSTKILNKAVEYYYIMPWLGTGLLTSDGPKWKKRRKILTPAFHFQILEQFIQVFESSGDRLIQKLRNKVGLNSFDIYPFITLCTLDIICETAMGISINAQFDDNSEYVRSVKSMCKIVSERIYKLLQMSDLTFFLTKNFYIQKKSLKVLHKQTNDVIVKRREELNAKLKQINNLRENGNNVVCNVFEEEDAIGPQKKVFLDLLLEATIDGKPLTQEEIREEVDTFMFEGHDTTASAISFALYCLANNSEVQTKAYEEQVMLFRDEKNPDISYASLQNMKYLELVIKETLRLYPSVPYYARETTELVEHDGIVIPKGVTIGVFAYGAHRNPIHFKDPEKFDPDRFACTDGKYPYSYIPFSAGPRNCIGQKFAMLEMKSTISKVLRYFKLTPALPEHKLMLSPEAVLKSANGVKISFQLR